MLISSPAQRVVRPRLAWLARYPLPSHRSSNCSANECMHLVRNTRSGFGSASPAGSRAAQASDRVCRLTSHAPGCRAMQRRNELRMHADEVPRKSRDPWRPAPRPASVLTPLKSSTHRHGKNSNRFRAWRSLFHKPSAQYRWVFNRRPIARLQVSSCPSQMRNVIGHPCAGRPARSSVAPEYCNCPCQNASNSGNMWV